MKALKLVKPESWLLAVVGAVAWIEVLKEVRGGPASSPPLGQGVIMYQDASSKSAGERQL